jgi:hypothetical protein
MHFIDHAARLSLTTLAVFLIVLVTLCSANGECGFWTTIHSGVPNPFFIPGNVKYLGGQETGSSGTSKIWGMNLKQTKLAGSIFADGSGLMSAVGPSNTTLFYVSVFNEATKTDYVYRMYSSTDVNNNCYFKKEAFPNVPSIKRVAIYA